MKKNKLLDKAYRQKLGKTTMDEYEGMIVGRKKRAEEFFNLLPASLKTPEDLKYKNLDRKIVAQLRAIERKEPTWAYSLKERDLLGQEFDEKTAYFWSCTKETGRFLHTLILSIRPQLVLELGTSVGYSTLWMADACKKVGGTILTIEYLDEKVKLAKGFFTKADVNEVVQLVQRDIRNVLEDWQPRNANPRIVFMDANKEWQRYYLTLLEKILLPGSLIVTDNVYDTYDIQEEFLKEAYTNKSFISLFIPLDTHGTLLSVKI